MNRPPVLLLGLESTIGLAIMRELGRHGVPVCGVGRDATAFGRTSRHCTRFLLRGPGPLGRWLPEMIAATRARALFAFSERDLLDLADLPARIGDCDILVARKDPLARILDKARTIAAARACGIEVPVDYHGTPDRWPVVLKWPDPLAVWDGLEAQGAPLHKTEYCADAEALEAALARYRPLGLRPLVQSYAGGIGIAQMFYREAGRTTLYFQHEQLHEWPPEGGIATLCRALDPRVLAEQRAKSETLLNAVGWEGPAMVEYRYDVANGACVFMEVNGRFWGSQPLATAAGAEFAWEHYRRRILGETGDAPPYRPGVTARLMVPETRRLWRVLAQPRRIPDPSFRRTPWRDLAGYLAGFLNPAMRYYVFSARDPRPFLTDIANMSRALVAPVGLPGETHIARRMTLRLRSSLAKWWARRAAQPESRA